MIRNVVLHLHNEMPMQADIESLPTAADAGLLCTNLRTMEGRKPLSTEYLDSVFLIPYNVIRFIEIPRASIHKAGIDAEVPESPVGLPAQVGRTSDEPSVVVTPPPANVPAAPAAETPPTPGEEAIEHLEPDEELLRRIREA